MNGYRKCGIHTMEYYSVLKEYLAICNSMDEPGGHYAKWSKPNTEGQILHDPTYLRNIVRLIETGSGMVISRWWGDGEKGTYYPKGRKFQLYKMTKS